MRRVVTIVLFACLLAGCASAGKAMKAGEEAASAAAAEPVSAEYSAIAEKTGPALEPFVLKVAQGGQYDVSQTLAENKVIMISFWATWCGPCKTELERMAPVYDDLVDSGFEYLAVSTDSAESVSEVRPYIRSCGYEFPVLLDTTGDLMSKYNPRGDLPFYVLVNTRGEVVEMHQGFKPGDEVAIEGKVKALLKAK